MTPVSLSTVIVAHDSLSDLRQSLPPLLAQLGDGDELIIVDNGPGQALADELRTIAPNARIVVPGVNVGFAAGANAGAAAARGELVVLLNPDAIVQSGWGDAIRAPWGGEWTAWMALVLLADGERINTSGGILHFTGFGWAGQIDEPVAAAPLAAREVGFLSGACLAIPRETWTQAGGFPAEFFMYCEDVDLSLRLRLSGGNLGLIPDARVAHGYHFVKGANKWRMLERNRWATIIRTYPAPVLAVVGPALIAAEAAVWVFAARGGWAGMKGRATIEVLRALPRLLGERRAIQATRRIAPGEFAAGLTADLSSPYLGDVGRRPVIRAGLRLYWGAARVLLRRRGGRSWRSGPRDGRGHATSPTPR